LDRREQYCITLFTAGDVDGDGKFTSSEFAASIHNINPDVDESSCLRMFREASQLSHGDSLEVSAFCEVIGKYGLLDKWWKAGGSIYSSINNYNAISNTWRKTHDFCVGTLASLIRDLPPHHKLRHCKTVGDGCLKCIQNRITNFENTLMEKKATEGETASTDDLPLEWQSYWLILQDLHKAAKQSEGVLTMYEGGQKIRDRKAPTLSPRNVLQTPANQRKRRRALPMVFLPDTNRATAVVSENHNDRTGLRRMMVRFFDSSVSFVKSLVCVFPPNNLWVVFYVFIVCRKD
jgi:hypothetical protein